MYDIVYNIYDIVLYIYVLDARQWGLTSKNRGWANKKIHPKTENDTLISPR